MLTATARLVAQGETVGTTTSAGTPAALELKRFGHFNGAITRNGTALGNVVSAEIAYANNLDRSETIRSDGRIDGADPSIAALTGRIEVRFADQTLVTQAINGEACAMEFAYLVAIMDWFTRKVLAWRISNTPPLGDCKQSPAGRREGRVLHRGAERGDPQVRPAPDHEHG